MADTITSEPDSNAPQWDEDVVYAMLQHPVRRILLAVLATKGPTRVEDLTKYTKRKFDATRKHLNMLRAAGLVMMTSDGRDGRRCVYALAPDVPVLKTANGIELNFVFCAVPLSRLD